MTYDKWYLKTWFIALMFALWFLYGIPLIIGIILLVKQNRAKPKIDAETKREIARLQSQKESIESQIHNLTENRDYEKAKLKKEVEDELTKITSSIEDKRKLIIELNDDITKKKKEVATLDEELSLQEFGIYTPIYSFANSEQYKDRLTTVRQKQKEMIKNKTAVIFPDNFQYNNSLTKGRALVNDNVKQILRSFNNECEVLIDKVKFNSVDSYRGKIEKSFEQLNKINARMSISLTTSYLKLKLDELNLAYEYALKKQEEKELQKEERARLREEAKLQKEIEEARKEALKEKQHYENALRTLLLQLSADPDNRNLIDKKGEIEAHLDTIADNIKNIDYRETNKRAGYVYIISNIGSFGENVYKIGMTRRLEPMDRISELGDASVPFNFDVHAMIFSDDAPALESALHHAFERNKVNMINTRREFFKVSLDEIKAVVREHFDKTVEFINIPEAEQYRESLMLKKQAASTI